MKNKIDRLTEATRLGTHGMGTRSIAMVLFFVMLLTAIGSGSVLSAFAVITSDDAVDDTAAVETVDPVAEEAVEDSYAAAADEFDTEDTMLSVGTKKEADLASTSAFSRWQINGYQSDNNNFSWNKTTTTYSINSQTGYKTIDLGATPNKNTIYFKVVGYQDSNYYINDANQSAGTNTTVSADTAFSLTWHDNALPSNWTSVESHPNNSNLKFTPSKRYVTFLIYQDNGNKLIITERDNNNNISFYVKIGTSSTYTSDNLKYYTFNGAYLDGAWPGKAISNAELVDANNGIYKITTTNLAQYVIFNDGGSNQTANLTIQAGKMYDLSDDTWKDMTTPLTTPQISLDKTYISSSGTDVTVHFDNWTAFSDAASTSLYTLKLYKSGSSTAIGTIKANDTRFKLTSAGDYFVKCEPTTAGSASYSASISNTVNVKLAPAYDFQLIGDVGADAIATVNGSANTGTGAWPDDKNWSTANKFDVNTATATPGIYTITLKTTNVVDWDINIGLYQKSASAQRGYKLGNTFYNEVGADYAVPNAGVSDADDLYIVDGSGSIILAPDTEYTITIDQTQPLSATYPYGKITITTNKADVTTVARVKRFDISTGQPGTAITNAPAYIGTAVAQPATGVKPYNTVLTAAAGAGYTFDGWYTDAACTKNKDTANPKNVSDVNASTTYYALFTENAPEQYTYNVTTDSNGTAGDVTGTGVFNNKVYKGGTLKFSVTPNTGYLVDQVTTDSGVATVSGNNITVSNVTKNVTVNVTFKKIETWALKLTANSSTYGKISSVTYYNGNGKNVTTTNPTNNSTINVQKGTEVSLTAAANTSGNKGDFTGWTLESGKYQRSKDTPLSATTIKIKPSADQTVTANFSAQSSEETSWGIQFKETNWEDHKFRHYQSETHNGLTNIHRSTFSITKGEHEFYFYFSSVNHGTHSSRTNLDPTKAQWVNTAKLSKSGATNYKITFPEAGEYTFYVYNTSTGTGDEQMYQVDVVKGSASSSSGSDDTPSTTGYTKLYVLDGIVTRNNDAIQSFGTNKFGDSIILSANSGILANNYYDATGKDLFVNEDAGHDEGQSIYYYDPKADLDFRVQTTIAANHKNIGVRAFVMNGMTYMAKKSKDGVYYADITLDANSDQGVLEVIPVYYNTLIPEKDYIKFYVDANTIGDAWGKTIGYSLWYKETSNHGMEGGYPGQPLMSDGNLLYGYFPKYYVGVNDDSLPTAAQQSAFAGVLLTNLAEHNYTHQDVMKAWGVSAYNKNYQTFDYEDPAEIAKITDVDTIEFIAKYKTLTTAHRNDSNYNSRSLNGVKKSWPTTVSKPTSADDALTKGFEYLTDIDGKHVNIFNDSTKNLTGDPLYVISAGNQKVSPNDWDTVWEVYSGTSGNAIAAARPVDFINGGTTTLQNALKSYTNRPVLINYEGFLAGEDSNTGTRLDGRWVYSKSTDATTLRLRVATMDSSGNLTFNNDFLDWAEISNGYVDGIKEALPSGVTNDTKLLHLDNRTTEVTAKINPVGYKVDGFYMLGARYSNTADNGYSSNLSDYDNMNAEGTATSFVNARDNRMVIIVSEIPNTDLLITHQMYGGPGAHKIKGFYYLKAELLNGDGTVKATYNNSSSASDGTTNKDIMISGFTTAAPKGQGYKLRITIKTTMSGSATFYQWYENDHHNGYNELDSDAARGSSDPVTTTKLIDVDDLYGNLTTNLFIKNLDYYSDLQAADSININHLLIGDLTDGQAYNKVTVTDSTGKAIKGGEYSERNRTTVVDSSFITAVNATNGYQIMVEIWTVPGANVEFDKFYHADQSELTASGSYEDVAYTLGEKVTFNNVEYQKATAMIPISYFFKDAPSEDGTEIVKVFDDSKKNFNLYSSLKDLSGELEITHQLVTPHTGTASTYITVDLCDKNNTVTQNLIAKTDTTDTADHMVKIGKEYIKPDTDNKLKITLTTELGDWTDFVEFDRMVNSVLQELTATSDVGLTATVSINTNSNTTMTATILFRIANLFDSTTKEQTTSRLDFYSKVEQPTFNYDITYNYNAYVASYGKQSYNKTGTITQSELTTYMTYNHEELRFNNDTNLKKTFISSKAPLEDNFMQTIDYANYETAKTTYAAATHTLTIIVEPKTTDSMVNVNLLLPYLHNATTYEPTHVNTDGLVIETADVASTRQTQCKGWVVTSGKQFPGSETEGEPQFIKAPLLLFNSTASGHTKHFLYWSVMTQAKYDSEAKEYTRCYDYEFNLAIFQDCTVKPVYAEGGFDAEKMPNPPTRWDMYDRFDPYVMRNADTEGAGGVTITFMENSRNQYNHNGSGNTDAVPVARQGAADRIYSDFLLSYNNIEGIEKLQEHGGEYKCGVIIEAAGNLDENGDDYIIDTEANYRSQYQATANSQAVTDLISSNATSANGRMKAEFDVSELDDKNRTRYYVGLNNRAAARYNETDPPEIGDSYLSTTTRVLRAYAYIYKVGENGAKEDIKISDPAYFTIYNIATVQDGGNYTGN